VSRKKALQAITKNIELFVLLLAAGVLIVIFSSLEPSFLTLTNFRIIIETMSILVILALGLNTLLIAGEMDISFTSVLEFAATVAAVASAWHLHTFFTIALGLIAAATIGVINAVFVTKLRIPSFLVTLATMVIVKGAVLIICNYRAVLIRDPFFLMVFHGRPVGNLATSVYWMVLFVFWEWFVLRRTKFGRWIVATGGNEKAARLMGIPTARVKFMLFVQNAVLAGFAGFILASRAISARPMMGQGYFMPAMAAPILGGALLTGGQGSVPRTVLAAFVLTLITNGVNLLGLEPAYRDIFMGVILVSALSFRHMQARSTG